MMKETLLIASLCAAALPAHAAKPDAVVPPAAADTNKSAAKLDNKLTELFGDEVVAKAKGFEIKRSQIDEAVIPMKSSAAARGQPIPPEQVTRLEQQVLDRLVQIQLLLSKATDADKAAGKVARDKRYETIKTRSGSEEALIRNLKSVGMTIDELQAKMLEESIAESVLERELKINVTDDDVKKFYDENPSKFEQPEMVRASHILLTTRDSNGTDLPDDQKTAKRKKAEDLVKRAKAGEDFAKLAKENSEDPGSKDTGGEYTFPRGKMVPEFESAAFSLQTNQVSEIVTTQFGYHIIKLSEKIPAKKTELTKVSQDIKDYLKQQATQKQLPDYMKNLKKESDLQILDAKLKMPEVDALALPPGHPDTAPPSPKK
jgi:peptidyl-prolyl cis-trans isomerase C